MPCIFGHKWDGCKCVRCGKIRDEAHAWESIAGKCEKKCATCGKTKTIEHKYERLRGQCLERCAVCGLERRILHEFEQGVCKNCGVSKNSLGTSAFVQAAENAPRTDNAALLADWLDDMLGKYAGQGSFELLEPACRSYANALAVIADEWKSANILSAETNSSVEVYYGLCANVCIRTYLHKRIPNGVFGVEEAQNDFDRKAVSPQYASSVHPSVHRKYLDSKLEMILSPVILEAHPLKLPFGLATKETGDKIVWCVAQPKATIKKALQEETYDMLCAYIQARMDATSV